MSTGGTRAGFNEMLGSLYYKKEPPFGFKMVKWSSRFCFSALLIVLFKPSNLPGCWGCCRAQRGSIQSMISNGRDFFVGWGTLALINAGLAQGKGRSGLNWFLLSLLLGPVATFLIVILDPLDPHVRFSPPNEED